MGITIEHLAICLTDICNMCCGHCLRGDAGDRKMDLALLPKIFEGITTIEDLTLTGGEPGCDTEAVLEIVDYLENSDIDVRGFFIATNGKEYHPELEEAVKRMWFRFLERDLLGGKRLTVKDIGFYETIMEEYRYRFGLAVSMDPYHEPVEAEAWMRYRFSGIYTDSKVEDFARGGILSRGRGAGLMGSVEREMNDFNAEKETDGIRTEELYISLDGLVFPDCNMSYTDELEGLSAGSLYEDTLASIIEKLAEGGEG